MSTTQKLTIKKQQKKAIKTLLVNKLLVVKFYCKILFMCIKNNKKQQKTTKNNKLYVTKIIRLFYFFVL